MVMLIVKGQEGLFQETDIDQSRRTPTAEAQRPMTAGGNEGERARNNSRAEEE